MLAAVVTDWFFTVPAIRVAEARTAAGASDTWMYRFDHPDPRDNYRFGACHATEIPFVFDTATRAELRPLIGDAPSPAVANVAHRVWVDFITSGDPGWARYDQRDGGPPACWATPSRRPATRPATSARSGTASARAPARPGLGRCLGLWCGWGFWGSVRVAWAEARDRADAGRNCQMT